MALNRTTIISIIATSIIIGLSIGMTIYFNPESISSLERHYNTVTNSVEMQSRCSNLVDMMNQDEQIEGKNNVMAYNLQRLHGQCYVIDNGAEVPVELLKLTGCSGEKLRWKLKEDSSIFDFCPNINTQVS